MRRIIIVCTLALLILPLRSLPHAADKITQETRGDHSPAIVSGRDVTFNYNYIYNQMVTPTFSEIMKQYSECIRLVVDFQNKKLEELDKKLAEFFIQQTGAPDQDAKKWVDEVIKQAPEYKKQVQQNEKAMEEWNKEFSKNLIAKAYELFIYVFATIDARFEAFKEANPNSAYERSEKFILFTDASQSDTEDPVRAFTMPTGKRILIHCFTGKMNRGIIVTCPSLKFSDATPQGIRHFFSITPKKVI